MSKKKKTAFVKKHFFVLIIIMNLSKQDLLNLIDKTEKAWYDYPERDSLIIMNNKVYQHIDEKFVNLKNTVKHNLYENEHVLKNIVNIIRTIKTEYEIAKHNYFNNIMSSQNRKRRHV